MLRNAIGALLLACASPGAYAGEQSWAFTYTGFMEYPVGVFQPDHTLSGTFKGTDLDNDGTLTAPELSSFFIGSEYVGCTTVHGPESNFTCSLNGFSFNPATGSLSFHTYWQLDGWDPPREQNRTIIAGLYDEYWAYLASGDLYYVTYGFTPATTLVLANLTPVPEPAPGAMLAAGLATLCLVRRRRGVRAAISLAKK